MAAALFVDTFNATFESENALAAARVLKKAGYTLYLVRKDQGQHCCGRTFLAAGMVDKAKAKAYYARLVDLADDFRDDDRRQQPDDDHHHHDLDERETACPLRARAAASANLVGVGNVTHEFRWVPVGRRMTPP